MDSNQKDMGSLPPSEDRVFEVAQSLIPAAGAFARRHQLDSETAHEAMIEAARRVVKALSSPQKPQKPIENLPAYLFRIGQNLMLEELNRARHEIQLDNEDLPVIDTAIETVERKILVSEIVRRMGPKARMIFNFRAKGLNYNEIAEKFKDMGYKATGGSLRSELSKAAKRIKDELRGSGENLFDV
jgi:RNA polymerase sigma factor (sigma-70 family)